jgi:hypothetical protein
MIEDMGERGWHMWVTTCDECGDDHDLDLLPEATFHDAAREIKALGWRAYTNPTTGLWRNQCPACVERMEEF